jgi:glycosyltransferase involved in cell wall biosynthesis
VTSWHEQRRAGRRPPPPVTDEPNAEGSSLEGYVEHPLDGAEVERRFVVSGWHAWVHQPVAAVVVDVGGVTRRAQASETTRDDVAADHGSESYLQTGWVAEFDLSELDEAVLPVRVTIFPAVDHGGIVLEPRTLTLLGKPAPEVEPEPEPEPNELSGRLDTPRAGERVPRGALTVGGWATTTQHVAVRSVTLSVGDAELGRARLGLGRLDVAANDEAVHAPLAGFEQLVDLSMLDAGIETATLRATVEALDGTVGVLEHEVVLDAARAMPVAGADRWQRPAPPPKAPLHLLACTHDLGLGGAQLWLTELLARSGAGRSYPCTVVAFAGGVLADQLAAQGVEVHVTSPLPVHDAAAYEGRLEELSAWLGERSFTGAIVNTFRAFPAADLAERHGLPVVWAIHESWPQSLIWSFDHPGVAVDPHVRELAERSLREAAAVVFESEATRSLYAERAAGRTLVVPFGVDTAALDRFAAATDPPAARRAVGLDDSRRHLLVMGTIEPRKGQGLLVEAFAEVSERHGDVDLVLVGDLATAYSRAIREFVGRAGLGDRVRIEPVTRDANLWYRACDALVCASDVESMPRSVLDAMCLGLPVLATSVFGLAELLADGDTGLLFAPVDLAAAVDGLDRLCTLDAEELAGIAARGRALVHEHHDSIGYATDVLALLEGLRRAPGADPTALLARHARGSSA